MKNQLSSLPTQELFRVRDVAEMLGVTPARVYQMVAARDLPATRIGGAIRIPRLAWEIWVKGRAGEALASLRHREELCHPRGGG